LTAAFSFTPAPNVLTVPAMTACPPSFPYVLHDLPAASAQLGDYLSVQRERSHRFVRHVRITAATDPIVARRSALGRKQTFGVWWRTWPGEPVTADERRAICSRRRFKSEVRRPRGSYGSTMRRIGAVQESGPDPELFAEPLARTGSGLTG